MSDEPLPDVGRPLHLFIDTSIFQSLNFAFNGKLLGAVLSAVDSGDVRLIVPDVTRREVQQRIKGALDSMQVAIAPFRKAARILKVLPGHPITKATDGLDLEGTLKSLHAAWATFLKKANPIRVSATDADVAKILDDYFENRAPFGAGDKKSEFPDAFTLYALLHVASKVGQKVVVVSNDGDFKQGCKRFESLVFSAALQNVLEHAVQSPLIDAKEFHTLLERQHPRLETEIIEHFENRGFFWDADDGYDAHIDEIYDVEIEELDLSMVSIKRGYAEVAGSALVFFRASATFPDPDMICRDDETGELVAMANKYAKLATTVDIPVTFRVKLKELRAGDLLLSDLSVNNQADIWFRGAEIEELESEDIS